MRESMEKLNIEKKKEKEELKWAWNELIKLINEHKEAKIKKEPYDPRLAVIEEKELIKEKDAEIFGKFKKGLWTRPEFRAYTDEVSKDLGEEPNNSRDNLRDWLAEKAQLQFEKERSEDEQRRL